MGLEGNVICPNYPEVYPYCTGNATLWAKYPEVGNYQVYADLVPTMYAVWRSVFLIVGILLLVITIYRVRLAWISNSAVHKVVYTCLMFATVTFILRGIDPHGYKGIVPIGLPQAANIFTNGFLYTIFYAIGIIWGSVLQSFCVGWRIPIVLRIVGIFLLVITWGINCMLDISTILYPAGDHLYVVMIKYYSISVTGLGGTFLIAYTGFALDRKIRETAAGASQPYSVTSSPAASAMSGTEASNADLHKIKDSPSSSVDLLYRMKKREPYEKQSQKSQGACCGLLEKWKRTTKIMKIVYILVPMYLAVEAATLMRGITAQMNGYDYTAWQSYNLCVLEKGVKYAGRGPDACVASFDYIIFGVLQLSFAIVNTWIFSKIRGGDGRDSESEKHTLAMDRRTGISRDDLEGLTDPASSPNQRLDSTDSTTSFWSGGDGRDSFVLTPTEATLPSRSNFSSSISRKNESERTHRYSDESSTHGAASLPTAYKERFGRDSDIESLDDIKAGLQEKLYLENEDLPTRSFSLPGNQAAPGVPLKKPGSYRKL